jgi:hypothetical protein
VDEIHAMVDDKRGSHLALSVERLQALVEERYAAVPAADQEIAGRMPALPEALRAARRLYSITGQNPKDFVRLGVARASCACFTGGTPVPLFN